MESKSGKRIGYLDFLKVIALVGIVIAHISPPKSILMLRKFDVILMMIISAFLGGYRTENIVNRTSL